VVNHSPLADAHSSALEYCGGGARTFFVVVDESLAQPTMTKEIIKSRVLRIMPNGAVEKVDRR
jgi:hypothetical protein